MSDAYELREGESVQEFAARIKAMHTAPTWAQLRARDDHADKAYEFLASAPFNGDAEMAKVMVDAATVHATLGLIDKVEELCQTMKHVVGSAVESVQHLDATIQKATNVTVVELRKATVREVA